MRTSVLIRCLGGANSRPTCVHGRNRSSARVDQELLELTRWFAEAKLPDEPFWLFPGVQIADPERLYRRLRSQIAAGGTSEDLRFRLTRLREVVEGQRGEPGKQLYR